MSTSPFVYPEDYGAPANGTADDFPAITAAIAAAPVGRDIMFSGTYATSQPIQSLGRAFVSTGSSTLTALDGCKTGFQLSYGGLRHVLPTVSGFSEEGVLVDAASVIEASIRSIRNCGAGFTLKGAGGSNPGTNTLRAQFIAGCNAALKVVGNGGIVQGNDVYAGFVSGCNNGLLIDGSPNCDSNTFLMGSFDATGAAAGSAAVFNNTLAGKNPCSTWELGVRDWIGGLPTVEAGGRLISGPFQFCKFRLGNPVLSEWGFNANTGGGNTYEAAIGSAWAALGLKNWMAVSNNRALWGGPRFDNAMMVSGAWGAFEPMTRTTIYCYSPYTDGGSHTFDAVPIAQTGVAILDVFDNSATVPNEVGILVENQSGAVIGPSQPFTFKFLQGLS